MRSRVLRVVALLCLMLGALSAQVAPVVVTVSPTLVTLPLGNLQLFSATVSGTGNTAVTWSVNGIAGGNATVGTINGSGLYTAPPFPIRATVTATSVADSTKSASATVNVTSPNPAIPLG